MASKRPLVCARIPRLNGDEVRGLLVLALVLSKYKNDLTPKQDFGPQPGERVGA